MMVKRIMTALALVALLASNILSLTWGTFQTAASGLLAAASIPTLTAKRARANAAEKLLVKKTGANIGRRTIRSAAVNVGSMAGEALPFVGWAVIVGATGYELKLACENLLDLESLYADFGIDDHGNRSAAQKICDPNLSAEASELSVWARDLVAFEKNGDAEG